MFVRKSLLLLAGLLVCSPAAWAQETGFPPKQPPRKFFVWRPLCGTIESNLGPVIIPTTDEESACIDKCVQNFDGENYRAYQHYCIEDYNLELCKEALRRFTDETMVRCRLDCCETLKPRTDTDAIVLPGRTGE